jgi:hypothetical protein
LSLVKSGDALTAILKVRYRSDMLHLSSIPRTITQRFIMRTTRLTLIGLIAAVSSMAALAQQTATTAPAPATAASSPAKDCTKAAKRHDHGMEKGMGPSIPNPCAPPATAAKKVHDHAKVHK